MRRSTIGKARHLVTLDVAGQPVPDGDGGFTETDVPLNPATWYCSIESASAGQERRGAGTVSATATHRLRGRFHPEITVETRVTFVDAARGGLVRYFELESVENVDERGIELELVAHEVLDGTGAAATVSDASRGAA
jgi:head-tail adaptor